MSYLKGNFAGTTYQAIGHFPQLKSLSRKTASQCRKSYQQIEKIWKTCSLVIPYCRYHCFRDSRDSLTVSSVLVQILSRFKLVQDLQILQGFVKIYLKVMIYVAGQIRLAYSIWKEMLLSIMFHVIFKLSTHFWNWWNFWDLGKLTSRKILEARIFGLRKFFSLNLPPIFSKLVPSFTKMFQRNAESRIDVRFKVC